jgi:hypothetical protein
VANTRTVDVLLCPWCDYVTDVSHWEHGIENARNALIQHLCRKRHQLSRREARETAKGQVVMLCEYDRDTYRYLRETAREKAQGGLRVDPPAGTQERGVNATKDSVLPDVLSPAPPNGEP